MNNAITNVAMQQMTDAYQTWFCSQRYTK